MLVEMAGEIVMGHGFSVDRLEYLTSHLQGYVDDGLFPGCSCLVTRHGEEAYFRAFGERDVERSSSMDRDTVVRIYSMSKPITSVALMTLYEQGKFQMDDPVSKFVPQWSALTVYEHGDNDAMVTSPTTVPLTIKHLLTHTSGLTYGFMNSHPVDALYRSASIGAGQQGSTLQDMIDGLAEIPLTFTPGSRWNYSVATDVCGYLVELFSGTDLDVFVRERITGPLGMNTTGYQVPAFAKEKFAACYRYKREGGFELQDDPIDSPYHQRPTFFSGGGGMVGSIDDYCRFARMLLSGGELDGYRILGRKTVEYMTTNHMPGNVDLAAMGQPVFSETSYHGIGFGLGFSVVIDPAAAGVLGSPGEFAWGGAASTYFWVDPLEDMTVVFMTQLLPSSTYPIRRELKTLIYQAIEN
ncbi:MAG: serine hydrolase domain-containing protein [Pseudomonadales bacterium]